MVCKKLTIELTTMMLNNTKTQNGVDHTANMLEDQISLRPTQQMHYKCTKLKKKKSQIMDDQILKKNYRTCHLRRSLGQWVLVQRLNSFFFHLGTAMDILKSFPYITCHKAVFFPLKP